MGTTVPWNLRAVGTIRGRNDTIGDGVMHVTFRGESNGECDPPHSPLRGLHGGTRYSPSFHGHDILQRHSMGTIVPVESVRALVQSVGTIHAWRHVRRFHATVAVATGME
jgi:hypothetical protein